MGKHTHRFTRQALYDLVWSEPRTHLAKRLGISDVGIAKACRRALIPMPEAGYWAKKRAGKRTRKQLLPIRGLGMPDEVRLGGGPYWYHDSLSDAELKALNPLPPKFDEPLELLAERVRKLVGKVSVPRGLNRLHSLIAQLIEDDDRRREKQQASTYSMSWNDPKFDSPLQKRRLRIINAVFLCLERCSMKPGVGGDSANELSVQVGQQHVSFALEPVSTSSRRTSRSAGKIQKTRREKLRLQIKCRDRGREATAGWEDTDTASLETQLPNVVDALIVTGERLYREGIQHHYNWLVQRKTDLEEKERQRQAEQVRLEQERQQQREQARIDRLLTDASALRQAGEIRSYVERVVNSVAAEGPELPSAQLDTWVTWAIAQADRIDPVRSGRFIEAMKDPAEEQH